MMIHTHADESTLRFAARVAGVWFERLEKKGSRSHPHKFDVILSGSSTRRGNFGADHQAATWDEWGIFLGYVFRVDPKAKCTGAYESADHFRWVTDARFDDLKLSEQHAQHRFEYEGTVATNAYSVRSCECGAVHRWLLDGREFKDLAMV